MSLLKTWGLIAAAIGWLNAANAQLEVVSNGAPESVFCGYQKPIFITFHNASSRSFDGQIRARILQTTSATAVSIGEVPWKCLQVLPQQTTLESAQLDFPPVKAETLFLVQWIANSNQILGATSVLVYPTNLFAALQPYVNKGNFGLFDPANQIKPLLTRQHISFTDLGKMKLGDFSGRLAIIGPFQSKAQVPNGLEAGIKAIAQRNIAVVWIQPPEPSQCTAPVEWEREELRPSFYWVQKKQTAIVVVQPDLLCDLAGNPQSQIALIYFCHLALDPKSPILPNLCLNL